MPELDAVTLDFFNTLVRHPDGYGGRGKRVMEYLDAHGIESRPWEHQVLYDVFEPHAREYSPAFSALETDRYRVWMTERLLRRLEVTGAADLAADHAAGIWALIGPTSLEVFSDARPALEALDVAGYRLGVVSNWQCGLAHFCAELGLGDLLDVVVVSAEVGAEKPSPAIFQEACRRLGTQPDRILHVGDSPEEDIEGARAAGLQGLLLCRDNDVTPAGRPWIRTLGELPDLLGVE